MIETKEKIKWCGEDIETLDRETLLGVVTFLNQQLEANRNDMQTAIEILQFSQRNRKGL